MKKNEGKVKNSEMLSVSGRKWPYRLLFIGIMIAVILAIYANSVNVPFYFDDKPIILSNSNIIADSLSFNDIIVEPLQGPARFRALPMISFALNNYFGSFNVCGYHYVNIVLHILNTVLLFFLIFETLKCYIRIKPESEFNLEESEVNMIAFSAALIWGVSPLHTESVTYIVQRMNLMSMFFSLISILCYLKGRRLIAESANSAGKERSVHSRIRSILLFSAACCSAILALLSKENAAILPVVIFLYELFFFSAKSKADTGGFSKRYMWGTFYLIIIIVIAFILSFLWFNKNPIDLLAYSYIKRDFTMGERLLTESRIFWHYLSLLIFPLPSRLQLVYDYPLSTSLFSPLSTFPAVLGLFAVLVAVFRYAGRYRLEVFCIVWFFIQSLIESSFVGLELIFEHRTYIPSAFLPLLFILLLYRFCKNKKVIYTALALFALFSIYSTIVRNELWENPERFWEDNYRKTPQNKRAMLNYANTLQLAGKYSEAAELYKKIIDSYPLYSLSYGNYGETLAAEKRYSEAEVQLKKAIKLNKYNPVTYLTLGAVCQDQGKFDEAMKYYLKAEKGNQDNPIIITNIASLYRELKDWKKAEAMYQRALKLSPEMLRAALDLGLIYMKEKEYSEASMVYRNALKYYPKSAELYYRLGLVSIQEKNFKTAIIYLQNALILNPDLPGVRKSIADVHSLSGNAQSAVNSYKELLEHNPYDHNAHNNLGLMLLKQGDISGAEQHFIKALRLKPDFAAALKNMGNIMFIRKDYDQAAHYYQNALKVTPRDPVLYHNLGSVYAFKQDYEKARSCYTKALEIKPDYYEAQQNLQKVINK